MSSPANNSVSISRRPPDIEDYIDMIRRYRSWIIGPMFLGFVVATVIAFYWDDTYVSHATMKLVPQQVSEHLVQNNASTQLNERLTQITTTILSHSNLISIITDPAFNLYPKERAKGKALEDVATEMQNAIRYQLTGVPLEMGNNRVASAFEIRFSYTDRKKAKMVVDKLVELYEEQNASQQQAEAKHTNSFVSEQLKLAQQKLQTAEDAIARFTIENRGHLPQEFQSNYTMLQGLRMQLANANDQLANAQNNKMGLESQLTQLGRQQKDAEDNLTTMVHASQGESDHIKYWRQQVDQIRVNLAAAQKTYRDDMPEVTVLQTKLEFAKGELEKAEKEDSEKTTPSPKPADEIRTNPLMAERLENIRNAEAQVRIAIQQQDAIIRRKNGEIDTLQKDIIQVQHNIDVAGISSPEYNRLVRDRDMAQAEVQNEMKAEQGAAQQLSLENQQEGERLEALDLANLPDTPTEPKREIWTIAGTVLGLLVGLVLAGAKEVKNTSLKNLKDVRAYTNLPVLSSVPLLENALLVRRKRRLFWLVWTSIFIVGMVCISASMYYHYFVVRAV